MTTPRPPTGPRPVGTVPALVLAGAGGAAVMTAFPGTSWWPLAIAGVGALACAVRGRDARAGAGLGFVFGLALLVPLLRWTGLQVGPLPWLALAAFQSLFYAAAGAGLALSSHLGRGWARVLTGAGAWVGIEAVQGRYPWGGFGWSRLGFSQSTSPLLDLAALAGVPLISFVVVALGLLLAEAVTAARAGRPGAPAAGAGLFTAALLVVAGPLVPTPVTAEHGTVQVAGIQGNVPRLGLDFNAQRRAVLDNHARTTHQLADRVEQGAPAPDLVVWPENASDIDPFANPDAAQVITAAVDRIEAPTLLGTITARQGRIFNTVLVWVPGQGPVARYDKRAPVPFAEYVPHRDLFRAITPLTDLAGRFSAGTEVGVLTIQARDGRSVPVGVLICFEVVQDGLVADVVDAGAQLLVVPTNNATFGLSDESRQQLAISRIRAVQTGRSVAHVSTVGVSALIAPDGTILTGSELFTRDILTADLPVRSGPTMASAVGTAPELVMTLIGVAGLVGVSAARRRARPAPAPNRRSEATR